MVHKLTLAVAVIWLILERVEGERKTTTEKLDTISREGKITTKLALGTAAIVVTSSSREEDHSMNNTNIPPDIVTSKSEDHGINNTSPPDTVTSSSEESHVLNNTSPPDTVTSRKEKGHAINNTSPPADTVTSRREEDHVINFTSPSSNTVTSRSKEGNAINNTSPPSDTVTNSSEEGHVLNNTSPSSDIVTSSSEESHVLNNTSPPDTVTSSSEEGHVLNNTSIPPDLITAILTGAKDVLNIKISTTPGSSDIYKEKKTTSRYFTQTESISWTLISSLQETVPMTVTLETLTNRHTKTVNTSSLTYPTNMPPDNGISKPLPKIIISRFPIRLCDFDNITLTCRINGDMDPRIQLRKDFQEVMNCSRIIGDHGINCYKMVNATIQMTRLTPLIWPFPFSHSLCFIVYRANETLHCRIGMAIEYNWIMWPFNLDPSSCLLLNNESIYCIEKHHTLYGNVSKMVSQLQWSYELVLVEWPFPFSVSCRMLNNITLFCYRMRGGIFNIIFLKWPFPFIPFETCDVHNVWTMTCYIQRVPKPSSEITKIIWPFRNVKIIWPFKFSPVECFLSRDDNRKLYCPINRYPHQYGQLQWPFPFYPYQCIYLQRGMLHCYIESNTTVVESKPLSWSFETIIVKWPFQFPPRYCSNLWIDKTILCYEKSRGELFVKIEVKWPFPFALAACVLDYKTYYLTCLNTVSNKSLSSPTTRNATSQWMFTIVSIKWPFSFPPSICTLFTSASVNEVFFSCHNATTNTTTTHYWPFDFSPYQCIAVSRQTLNCYTQYNQTNTLSHDHKLSWPYLGSVAFHWPFLSHQPSLCILQIFNENKTLYCYNGTQEAEYQLPVVAFHWPFPFPLTKCIAVQQNIMCDIMTKQTKMTGILQKLPMSFLEAFCVIQGTTLATRGLICNVKYDTKYKIFRVKWPNTSPPGHCRLITGSHHRRLSCAVQNSSKYFETPWPFSSSPMSCELIGRSSLNQTIQCLVKHSTSTLFQTPWPFDFLPTPCMLQHNMLNIFCCPPFNKGYTTFTREVEFIFKFWISLCVCLFGLVGSVLSFLVLSTSQVNSSLTILKGVAICDGSYCLWYLVFGLYMNVYYGKRNWILDRHSESVHALPWVYPYLEEIESILIHISIWFIVLLTSNRYVAVCKPLKAKTLCTIHRTTLLMIALAVICIGSSVPSFLMVQPYWSKTWCSKDGWVEKMYTNIGGSLMFLKIYVISFRPLVFHILPAIFVTIMTIVILLSLRNASRTRRELQGTGVIRISKNEDKLTRLFIAVAVMFVCFVLPRVVADIMQAQDLLFFPASFQNPMGFVEHMRNSNKTIYMHIVSNLFLRLNVSLNFVLYILVNRDFRENLRHLPNRLLCRCHKYKRRTLRQRTSGSPHTSRHQLVTTKV